MGTPRCPGFLVVCLRFNERVGGEVRDGVEPGLTTWWNAALRSFGRDAFHCVPLISLWRTTRRERGIGNTEASWSSRRPPSVQRTRWGEVRDGVEPVLTTAVERVSSSFGRDAFHCVPLLPVRRTTDGKWAMETLKRPGFSRRPSSVQRTRWGEVRDAVERVLTALWNVSLPAAGVRSSPRKAGSNILKEPIFSNE